MRFYLVYSGALFTGLAKQAPMRFYLAGTHPGDLGGVHTALRSTPTARRLNILLSYHYYRNLDLDKLVTEHFADPEPELFIDSGAFSAMTKGATIDIPEYVAWVRRFAHRITTYSVLDVIGDPIKTRENQLRMEDMGMRPIPCWHVGESFDALEWYIERYPYIAIGGMVPYVRQVGALMPTLVRAFQLAKGRSVLHGFGATSWRIVSMLPWYSVDSSTWASAVRFGQVSVFNYRTGVFKKVQLWNRAAWMPYATLVRQLGFDPEDFIDRARYNRNLVCALSALSHMEAAAWLEKRHGIAHIPTRSIALEAACLPLS